MKQHNNKHYKKLSQEDVQQMLHFRKRGYVQQNNKRYTRKHKHKQRELDNTQQE